MTVAAAAGKSDRRRGRFVGDPSASIRRCARQGGVMIEALELTMRFGRRTVVEPAVVPGGSAASCARFSGGTEPARPRRCGCSRASFVRSQGSARIDGHDVIAERCAAAVLASGSSPRRRPGSRVSPSANSSGSAGSRVASPDGRSAHAIDSVTERVHAREARDTLMGELSKGWRQRAWLAQALLHDPPALILDEPTDGLDPVERRHVRALLEDVCAGQVGIALDTRARRGRGNRRPASFSSREDASSPTTFRPVWSTNAAGSLAPAFHRLAGHDPEDALGHRVNPCPSAGIAYGPPPR